jgi:hypothetical protein
VVRHSPLFSYSISSDRGDNLKHIEEDFDTYAIPEAFDASFAVGFGNLSVHEVA